ncbi:hypothetical protein G7046_g1772 [Stylonectria norvegica]|nr:hypothetical protein G7046_g1772 [Stylonectria norvegica]
MSAAYTTTEIRQDHTGWRCNAPMEDDPHTLCGEKMDLGTNQCARCNTKKSPGAFAANDDGDKIGTYKGNDEWECDLMEGIVRGVRLSRHQRARTAESTGTLSGDKT